jgi:hypothetical protein
MLTSTTSSISVYLAPSTTAKSLEDLVISQNPIKVVLVRCQDRNTLIQRYTFIWSKGTNFSNQIGIDFRWGNDGTNYEAENALCPNCGHRYSIWTKVASAVQKNKGEAQRYLLES